MTKYSIPPVLDACSSCCNDYVLLQNTHFSRIPTPPEYPLLQNTHFSEYPLLQNTHSSRIPTPPEYPPPPLMIGLPSGAVVNGNHTARPATKVWAIMLYSRLVADGSCTFHRGHISLTYCPAQLNGTMCYKQKLTRLYCSSATGHRLEGQGRFF